MLTICAPAKINLSLLILDKRDDGYHEIFTIMQPISLFDVIKIDKARELRLKTNHPSLHQPQKNLVYQAATLFFKRLRAEPTVQISLYKRIPLGAGLGGGSSDAAATLIGLNQLFGHPLPFEDLLSLTTQLGSDVAFFLYNCPSIATGRGEKIQPLPFALPFWYVIVVPPIEVSTKWAYSQVRLTRGQVPINISSIEDLKKFFVNDFEPIVGSAFEEIIEAKSLLQKAGAQFILLSGSGSSVFAWCQNRQKAIRVKRRLRLPPRWQAFVVKGL